MRSAVFGVLAAILVGIAVAGCSGISAGRENGILPPELPPGVRGISESEILEARRLYVDKCAKCHRFYHPANYSASEWSSWMKKMSRKSKLKADQEELLSRYLGAFRLPEPPDKAGTPK